MKLKIVSVVILITVAFISGWFAHKQISTDIPEKLSVIQSIKPKPFEKYTIDNLSSANIESGTLELTTQLEKTEKYTSFIFGFHFKPNLKDIKFMSGKINFPVGDGPFPVIFMARGYIDQETYKTGDGTKNSSKYFSENGYITVAPDFLGYGKSDPESDNIFESRFQTYTAFLSLIKSFKQIKNWDGKNIFIWGHSNGGQIVLTTLEISGVNYPTVLWAPVSKPFPYSILYYTDESQDKGKLIRNELAKFEADYDVEKYSFTNFLNKINAPIQISQGGSDDAVPIKWSNNLVADLKSQNKDVTYFKYPKSTHDMVPDWNTVIKRDLEFFNNHLVK